MVTSPESISTPNSGKKMRRQWKSFNSGRNTSTPGDNAWDTPFIGTNINNPTQRDENMGEDNVFRNPDEIRNQTMNYGSVSHALRSQMAEEGSGEAQLAMARELLVQVAAGDASEENADKMEENAMYWLVRAAQQGEKEAVETVRGMAMEGRGVTDINYVDVETVVNMSCDDLIGNNIGHVLFEQMAEGRDFVTGRQLAKRVNESWGGTKQRSRQKITKIELTLAGRDYMQGKVPAIDEAIIHLDRPSLLTKTISNATTQNILLMAGIGFIIKLLITSLMKEAVYMIFLMRMIGQTISIFKTSHVCHRYMKWSLIFSSAVPTIDCDAQNIKSSVHSVLHISIKFFTCFAVITIVSSNAALSSSTIVISLLSFALLMSGVSIKKSKTFVLTIMIYSFAKSSLVLQSIKELDLIPQEYLQTDTLAVATLIPWSISGLFRQDGISFILQMIFISLLDQLLYHLQIESSFLYSSTALITFGLLASVKLAFQYKCHRKLVLFCLFLISILTLLTSVPSTPPLPTSLSWPVYHQNCLTNPSLTSQVSCLHFNGVVVKWKGSIHQVKILERNNLIEDIASVPILTKVLTWMRQKFPDLQNVLCHLGDPYSDCTSPQRSPVSRVMCQTRNEGSSLGCHWERYARYRYQIQVKMTNKLFGENQLINLHLEHEQGEFCAAAEEGNQVEFMGVLSLGVADHVPIISVSKISNV